MHVNHKTIMDNFQESMMSFYQPLKSGDLVSIAIVSWIPQQCFGTLFRP